MSSANRIALFLPDLVGGGAEAVMLHLASGLLAQGHAVDLVLVRRNGALMSRVPEGVRLIDLEARRALSAVPALAGYLRRERPQVLLSALRANLVAIWAKKLSGVPTRLIVTVHNTVSVEASKTRDPRVRLMPAAIRAFYPIADEIVAVSEGSANDLAQATGIARDRIKVIYNPLLNAAFHEKASQPVDHPWFTEDQPPVILSVGRLAPQKDFATLLRAFALLRQRRAARLVVLGEGPERERLTALARELGIDSDLEMPGFVGNPPAYMRRASAYALSSQWEGLPSVLVEALACGLPVVSTDCPSGPRELLCDGRYGLLTPMSDPAALCDGLCKALDGTAPAPSPECLRPFEVATATEEYLRLMLPDRPRRAVLPQQTNGQEMTCQL